MNNKSERGLTPSLIFIGINVFIACAAFVAWQPFNQEVTQKIYFPFGIMALLALSFFSKPKRKFESKILGSVILWSLISLFMHARISDESVTWRYLNFYLMSEGFIHVLFGLLFYKLVYEYSDKFIPALFIPIGYYLYRAIEIRSLTPIFAVLICSLIYSLGKKKYIMFSWIAIFTSWFVWQNWHYILGKAQARIVAWPIAFKQLTFWGRGFDKSIMQNMVLKPQGWGFIHNDFLNVIRDLGVPIAILILLFTIHFFKQFKFNFLPLACLCVFIVCFFQTTLYFPRNAAWIIALFALKDIKDARI